MTAYSGSRRFTSSLPMSTGSRSGMHASVANASRYGQRRSRPSERDRRRRARRRRPPRAARGSGPGAGRAPRTAEPGAPGDEARRAAPPAPGASSKRGEPDGPDDARDLRGGAHGAGLANDHRRSLHVAVRVDPQRVAAGSSGARSRSVPGRATPERSPERPAERPRL